MATTGISATKPLISRQRLVMAFSPLHAHINLVQELTDHGCCLHSPQHRVRLELKAVG